MTSPTTRRTHGTPPAPPGGGASWAAASALTSPAAPPVSASNVLTSAPPSGRRRPGQGALPVWFARCARSYAFHRSAAEQAGRPHQQDHEDQHQRQGHLDAVEEVHVLDGEG